MTQARLGRGAESGRRNAGPILVTGASSGIGRATTLCLARQGFTVFPTVRREEDAAALLAEAAGNLHPLLLDVTDPGSLESLREEAEARFSENGLCGLVNNAGLVIPGPLETLPLAALREQLEVNLFGVFQVTGILLPYLRIGHGRLVNVGSDSGRIAFPLIGAYNISKFALRGMTDTFRRELALWNLPVSLIEPGPVKTPIWDRAHEKAAELAYSLSEADRELYMDLYRAMERMSAEEGEQGVPPEKIARIIFHALTARRPHTHYLVGTNRFLFPILEKWIPARLLDRLILRKLGLRPKKS